MRPFYLYWEGKGKKDSDMNYSIDYLPDQGIVGVKNMGRLNFQIAEKFSKEAVKLAHQNECSKFLFDHIETTQQGGINKLHTDVEELRQFGFLSTDKVAVVIATPLDDSELPENDSQSSRCCMIKYFCTDNVQEAVQWLLEFD